MSQPSNHRSDSSPGISLLTPPRIFFALLIGAAVVELFLPVLPAPLAIVPWPSRIVSGLAIVLAGFMFMMWGHGRFVAADTPVKTRLPASCLVTGGAYRFSRNPMYVGFVAIALGIGAAANSLAVLLAAAAMFLYLDRFVIPREEAHLRERFDTAYQVYRDRVRRWL